MSNDPSRTINNDNPRAMSIGLSHETQTRNARILTTGLLIFLGLVLAYTLFAYSASQNVANLSAFGILGGLMAILGLTLFFIRRDQHIIGIGLLLGVASFANPIQALTARGTGVADGAMLVAVTLVIATSTLPIQLAWRFTVLGGVSAVVTVLLDVFGSPNRLADPQVVNVRIGIEAALTIICLAFLFRQFSFFSLRVKQMISFVLIAFMAITGISWYAGYRTTAILAEATYISLTSSAASQANIVGDIMAGELAILHSIALNTAIQNGAESANSAYSLSPDEIARELAMLDAQWANATDNDPIIQERLANPMAIQLKEFSRAFPENAEVFLTDNYGALIASNVRTSDFYQADELWWLVAYAEGNGKIYIGEPSIDTNTGILSIQIALPVFSRAKANNLVGILRTTYDLSSIYNLINGFRLGNTGAADLFFNSGALQLHGEFQRAEVEEVDPDTQAIILRAIASPQQVNFEGNEVLLASSSGLKTSTKVSEVDELNWFITVHQDTDEAFLPVQSQMRQLTLLGLLLMMVAITFSALVGKRLIQPIRHLTDAAEKVALGDLTIQAPVTTSDEVGILAVTINNMNMRLRHTLENLEERIEERTAELQLAGELGQTLSSVRDLDTLLAIAVDLIQQRFKLYYTQIYLTDSEKRSLVLRSGSGETGKELLRRGHRLPIGPGSLNGRAAAERQPMIVEDTTRSLTFRSNPLLPNTRSEMAIPLLVGDSIVGVLDMQGEVPGSLNAERLAAFQSLAGQLAVAIDNASLYQQAELATFEVEAQARRLSARGWQEYLNAIDRQEQMSAVYQREQVNLSQEALDQEALLDITLKTGGAAIGHLKLRRSKNEVWTDEEIEIAEAVAAQVSRQLENIRLLARAEDYRLEAEQATRRLVREAWDAYHEASQMPNGFAYDGILVKNIDDLPSSEGSGLTISEPLKVRQEVIGTLDVTGLEKADVDTMNFISMVTERLSSHIENLRLGEQTQRALSETNALYDIISKLNAAQDYQEILTAMLAQTALRHASQLAWMLIFDRPVSLQHTAEWMISLASSGQKKTQPNESYLIKSKLFDPQSLIKLPPTIIDDPSDSRFAFAKQILHEEGINIDRVLLIPLQSGDTVIGVILGASEIPFAITPAEMQLLSTASAQATIALLNLRLLEQASSRAQREQLLREITSQIASAPTTDSVLRTAVQEVGQALQRQAFIYLETAKEYQSASPEGNNDQVPGNQ